MARLVNCRLLKKELPGLEFPPFPGPDGQSIYDSCLLYTSPSPRDKRQSRMPSSA